MEGGRGGRSALTGTSGGSGTRHPSSRGEATDPRAQCGPAGAGSPAGVGSRSVRDPIRLADGLLWAGVFPRAPGPGCAPIVLLVSL